MLLRRLEKELSLQTNGRKGRCLCRCSYYEGTIFEAIANERKWEFGGENKRHFDLARWNIYGQVLVDFYKTAVQMGYNANFPNTEYLQWSNVPDNYYYRQVENPENPGTLKLEFVGLYKREKEPVEGKYTRKGFATGFIVQKLMPRETNSISQIRQIGSLVQL